MLWRLGRDLSAVSIATAVLLIASLAQAQPSPRVPAAAAPADGAEPSDERPPDDESKSIRVELTARAAELMPEHVRIPNRWALVIGAGEFIDGRILPLPACHNDAELLASTLRDPHIGMFPEDQVYLLTGAEVTRRSVIKALAELAERVQPDDLVLVFFSGHGAVDSLKNAYWVMHDTEADALFATALKQTEIDELLDRIATTRLVTLIDACYSAATARLGTATKFLPEIRELLSRFDGAGRVVISSSAGNQLSVVISRGEQGRGYSAFAWHVINGMRGLADEHEGNGDGIVEVTELWSYVKDRTEATARAEGGNQQPQLAGNLASQFWVTVDAERLVLNSEDFRRRTAALNGLALDQRIRPEHFHEAERLLARAFEPMPDWERKRLEAFTRVADGVLPPAELGEWLRVYQPPEPPPQQPAPALLAHRPPGARGSTPFHGAQRTVELADGVTAEFIYIDAPAQAPAGFLMGSPESEPNRRFRERQFTAVFSRGYWMQRTELTQAQWSAVMGVPPAAQTTGQGPDYPVYHVSWNDAQSFITALNQRLSESGQPFGVRLPTEAEWEFACRAGTSTAYWWGDSPDDGLRRANGADQAYKRLHPARHCFEWNDGYVEAAPVASFLPNAWGLYDMHGNVHELCHDHYLDAYPVGTATDYKGPLGTDFRVRRGGSWANSPGQLRAADRQFTAPHVSSPYVGFRLAMD